MNLIELSKNVVTNFINTDLPYNLREVVLSDSELWENQLLPNKVKGIIYQTRNALPKVLFIEQGTLDFCVKCLIHGNKKTI